MSSRCYNGCAINSQGRFTIVIYSRHSVEHVVKSTRVSACKLSIGIRNRSNKADSWCCRSFRVFSRSAGVLSCFTSHEFIGNQVNITNSCRNVLYYTIYITLERTTQEYTLSIVVVLRDGAYDGSWRTELANCTKVCVHGHTSTFN